MSQEDSPQDSLAGRLGRRGSRNILGLIYYGLANLMIVVVVSRTGLGNSGAFYTAIAVLNVLVRILVLGADFGLLRFISQRIALDRRREIAGIWLPALLPVVVVSALAGCTLFVYSDELAQIVGDSKYESILTTHFRLLAPILPLNVVYFILESASRGFGSVTPSLVLEKYGKSTLQLLLVSFAVAMSASSTILMLAWAGPIVVACLAMAAWIVREARRTTSRARAEASETAVAPQRRVLALEFWKFSAPRAPARIFQAGILWSDAIFIGAFASTASAGIYVAATRFMLVATLMQLGIGQVFLPLLSSALAREDREGALTLFRSASVWAMLASWPALIGVMSFAPLLLGLYGDEYRTAATALLVLGAAWMVTVAVGPVDSVLLIADRSWLTTANVAVAAAVNVGLNLVLIPRHGILGAAVAWSVSLLVNNVVPLLEIKWLLGFTPFGAMTIEALMPLGAFAASLVAARLLFGATAIGAISGSVVGLAIFVTVVSIRREQLGISAFRKNPSLSDEKLLRTERDCA